MSCTKTSSPCLIDDGTPLSKLACTTVTSFPIATIVTSVPTAADQDDLDNIPITVLKEKYNKDAKKKNKKEQSGGEEEPGEESD